MKKILVLLLAMISLHLFAEADFATADPDSISSKIASLISLQEPIVIDIQAGDLSTAIDMHMKQLLLEKGAQLLEFDLDDPQHLNPDPDSLSLPQTASLAFRNYNLVKVTMELGSTTLEKKGFLSYKRESYPLYTFQIKQIAMPGNRLQQIDQLTFIEPTSKDPKQSLTYVQWLEPVIATTALASIIFLLWTTE